MQRLMSWIDARFRSAYAMLTRPFGPIGLAARVEAFDVRNRGGVWGSEYDDTGWSGMVAAKRDWGSVTGLIELLHLSSKRLDREEVGLKPRQHQTQLQAALRMHW